MNQLKNRSHVGLIHIGKKEKSGLQIFEKLNQHQFLVTEWNIIEEKSDLSGINEVDSIVVNIGETSFDIDDLLNTLFDKNIKIIINEAELSNELTGVKRQSWERHLLNKIDPSISITPIESNNDTPINVSKFGIDQVWILAASIGGPEAIQEFLSVFKGDEKILFFLIQHMDKKFVEKMTSQLNNSSRLNVEIPVSGIKIKSSRCIVYPSDEYLHIDEKGMLEFTIMSDSSAFSPCIDECSKRLINNLANVNMAVFSGMSTDGVEAAKLIKEKDNTVITQNEKTCVLSTIIAGVKDQLTIDFDGTPTELAHYIIRNSEN